MTAPAPPREDAAPPSAVVLSEREAIDTLRVIAAMHGGHVNSLIQWRPAVSGDPVLDIGLCVYAVLDRRVPVWMWLRETGELLQRAFADMSERGGTVIPGGRIDRGLGAIR